MKKGKRNSKPENEGNTLRKRTLAGTLTLTATLAALGTSLGVDVSTLFAAEPMSEEGKLAPAGSVQIKLKGTPPAVQSKLKDTPAAVQDKMKGTPAAVQDKWKGTPPAARQLKIEGKAAAGQGTLKQGVPPSDTMKQNVVPAKQRKITAPDSGPVGTKIPGEIPAR